MLLLRQKIRVTEVSLSLLYLIIKTNSSVQRRPQIFFRSSGGEAALSKNLNVKFKNIHLLSVNLKKVTF